MTISTTQTSLGSVLAGPTANTVYTLVSSQGTPPLPSAPLGCTSAVGLIRTQRGFVLPVHGMDLLGRDRQDHPNLIAPAVPPIWTTGVSVGEEFDVL